MFLRTLVAVFAYWNRDIASILWPRGIEMLGVAKSLSTGAGFSSPFGILTGPTAFVTPVYPAILSVILRVFGQQTNASAWAILLLQCLISALTVIPIFAVALEVFDLRVAKSAVWIWALFPYAVILPTNIIWESTFSAFALAVGVYLQLHAVNSRHASRWIISAIWWAGACLLNAAFLLMFPALLLFAIFRRQLDFRALAISAAAFAIVLVPWSIRNYRVMGRLIPLRDNFPLELWIGNHSGTEFRFTPEIHPAFNTADLQHYQQVGELVYMDEKGARAKSFIRDHPAQFLSNTLKRIGRFWFIGLNGLIYLVAPLAAFGIAGLAIALRRKVPAAGMFGIILLVYPLPYYLTHPDMRYQHPIQPLLAVLAAVAVCAATAARPNIEGERSVV
jgi:4-amino-4-deoxy-L-arabinose transferase-like glycosyltransferase